MPYRNPAIISTGLTVLVLIFVTIVAILAQMVVLNGAGERQGTLALGISLLIQGAGWIFSGMLAWRLTRALITKYGWHRLLAVAVAVAAGLLLGGTLAFVSMIVAIPLAGIR